jgi:hypothetical protein
MEAHILCVNYVLVFAAGLGWAEEEGVGGKKL